jgi:hypothetical protein
MVEAEVGRKNLKVAVEEEAAQTNSTMVGAEGAALCLMNS